MPSTQTLKALIRALLEQQDFAGRDRLLDQVDGIEYVDGPVTMIRLRGVCPMNGVIGLA